MRKKLFLLVALPVAVGAIGLLYLNSQSAAKGPVPPPAPISVSTRVTPASVEPASAAPEEVVTATDVSSSVAPASGKKAKSKLSLAQRSAAPPKDPIQDPEARVALSLVGADSDAEAYWISAINDPNLPAEERKDLIEDLNEDGLSDPKHPSAEDMPLIQNRLWLLEHLEPMDQVSVDAMMEAHKDLVNLANGIPPQ